MVVSPVSSYSIKSESGSVVHKVKFAQPTRGAQSPQAEAIIAALMIYEFAKLENKKVKLLLSGGLDSEAMARCFIAAKVPFEVIVGRYDLGMNLHDIGSALEFCEEQKIVPQIIDVGVFDFLQSGEYLEYGKKYDCRSPQIATHLKLLDLAGEGVFVLGGNPMLPVISDPKTQLQTANKKGLVLSHIVGVPDQNQAGYCRYFERSEKKGFPFFFQSTPELIQSFLLLESTVDLMALGATELNYKNKCRIYQEGGFAVEPRADKFTGFEEYRKHYDLKMNLLHGMGFNKLFRAPLEQLFPEVVHNISFPLASAVRRKLTEKFGFKAAGFDRRQIVKTAALAISVLLFPTVAAAGRWCCYPEGCMEGVDDPCYCDTVPGPKC